VIRLLILADSTSRARRLAGLFESEDRIEVLAAGTTLTADAFVDVVIMAGVQADQITLSAPLVVLADESEPASFGQNVRAWLPLNALPQEIVTAVIAAAAELTVLTAAQARHWLPGSGPGRNASNQILEPLTSRELQVLRMLAEGLANKEIASRLGISEHTAKFHVAQILGKLAVGTRAEAVAAGIRRGFVPI
jgi:DNA-binding NarL/FixJ family response regulator